MSDKYYKIVDTTANEDCLSCSMVSIVDFDLIPTEYLELLEEKKLFGPKLMYSKKKESFEVIPVLYVCEIDDEDLEEMKKLPNIKLKDTILVIEEDNKKEEECS